MIRNKTRRQPAGKHYKKPTLIDPLFNLDLL